MKVHGKKMVGQVIFGCADFISDMQSRICEAKGTGEIPRSAEVCRKTFLEKYFPV